MANELGKRLGLVGWAITLTAFSALGLVLFIVTVTGIGLVVVSVGIPMLAVCLPLLRRFAGLHRRWAARQLGVAPIESSYAPVPDAALLVKLWSVAKDPATWRDLAWLFVNSTAGLAMYIIAIVESLLGLVFWWLPKQLFLDITARIARAMLSPNERTRLASRVRQLAESRAETVDTQAAEIRRIERDLHDGAQARLIARPRTQSTTTRRARSCCWRRRGPRASRHWPSFADWYAASIRRCSPTAAWPAPSRRWRWPARFRSRSKRTCPGGCPPRSSRHRISLSPRRSRT